MNRVLKRRHWRARGLRARGALASWEDGRASGWQAAGVGSIHVSYISPRKPEQAPGYRPHCESTVNQVVAQMARKWTQTC